MAAGKTAIPITPSSRNAGFPKASDMPETDNSTFKAGVPVLVTANKIVECGALPAAVWGFTERAGQNTTGATGRAYRAGAGAAFTITLTGTLPAAPIGTTAGLVKDAGGQWYADSASATKQLVITRVDSKWVRGTDTNAEVEVEVIASFVQNG